MIVTLHMFLPGYKLAGSIVLSFQLAAERYTFFTWENE